MRAKVQLFCEICKKMDDKRSGKWILQGNYKEIADKCRQIADVIQRRGIEKRAGMSADRRRNTKKSASKDETFHSVIARSKGWLVAEGTTKVQTNG